MLQYSRCCEGIHAPEYFRKVGQLAVSERTGRRPEKRPGGPGSSCPSHVCPYFSRPAFRTWPPIPSRDPAPNVECDRSERNATGTADPTWSRPACVRCGTLTTRRCDAFHLFHFSSKPTQSQSILFIIFILLSLQRVYRILLHFNRYYWVVSNFTWFYRA